MFTVPQSNVMMNACRNSSRGYRYRGLVFRFTEYSANRFDIDVGFKRQSNVCEHVRLHNSSHYQASLISAFIAIAVRVSTIHFPRPMPRV